MPSPSRWNMKRDTTKTYMNPKRLKVGACSMYFENVGRKSWIQQSCETKPTKTAAS